MLKEQVHTGEFLLSEANGSRSRDEIVIASGSGILLPGQLLGLVTQTDSAKVGKYVPYVDTATDGSQSVKGILYHRVDATSADIPAVIIDCDAEVATTLLTGLDADARTDLVALGIKLRA
jgi:hypothetical protein